MQYSSSLILVSQLKYSRMGKPVHMMNLNHVRVVCVMTMFGSSMLPSAMAGRDGSSVLLSLLQKYLILLANASNTFSNTVATAFAMLFFVTNITSENDNPSGLYGYTMVYTSGLCLETQVGDFIMVSF
ncbi:hypothetical protein Q3G72_009432 [Acer saccharum]|nr:hypothetical protein Q3G72_009432 [Acer saccharum]